MNIAEKLTTIAENEQKVYNAALSKGMTEGRIAGKNVATNEFWDNLTGHGTRIAWAQGFSNWGGEYIRPNRKIIATHINSGNQTFNEAKTLKMVEAEYFDFSQKAVGASTTEGYYYMFYGCSNLEIVEDIGLTAENNYNSAFRSCPKLHTIEKIRSKSTTKFLNTFESDYALENLMIDGTIGFSGFNVQWCPLTFESLISIIDALEDKSQDTSGTDWVIKLGANNLNTIGSDELLIAAKGWRYE